MQRREFLQLSGLSSLAVLLARLGWPVHGSAGSPTSGSTVADIPTNNSSQSLITIPFPIAARGEVAPPPPQHDIYIPMVSKS